MNDEPQNIEQANFEGKTLRADRTADLGRSGLALKECE